MKKFLIDNWVIIFFIVVFITAFGFATVEMIRDTHPIPPCPSDIDKVAVFETDIWRGRVDRFVDYDTNTVCYILLSRERGGISCMPLSCEIAK